MINHKHTVKVTEFLEMNDHQTCFEQFVDFPRWASSNSNIVVELVPELKVKDITV